MLSRFVDRQPQEAVLIDLATGTILGRSPGTSTGAFAPDGGVVATQEANGTIRFRSVPRLDNP